MAEVYDLNALKWTANSQSAATFTIDDPDLYIRPQCYYLARSGGRCQSTIIGSLLGLHFTVPPMGQCIIYKNVSAGNNYSWSLFQKITSPETFEPSTIRL